MTARFTLSICLSVFVTALNAQFTISADSVVCFGSSDGSAQIFSSTGYEYLYHWSVGDSIRSSISGLSAGTYSCTVSNLQGTPLDTLSVVISQPGKITFSDTTRNSSCPGADNGSIAVMVQGGGTPPYDFASTKNLIDYNFSHNGVISNLDTGLYTIFVSDDNGCEVTDTAFVGFSSSICTGITDIPQIVSLTLQPNPATDITRITYELNESLWLNISIYSPSGKKVQQIVNENETKGLHTLPVSLSSLARGTYILNVVSDKGSINIKLVKDSL